MGIFPGIYSIYSLGIFHGIFPLTTLIKGPHLGTITFTSELAVRPAGHDPWVDPRPMGRVGSGPRSEHTDPRGSAWVNPKWSWVEWVEGRMEILIRNDKIFFIFSKISLIKITFLYVKIHFSFIKFFTNFLLKIFQI